MEKTCPVLFSFRTKTSMVFLLRPLCRWEKNENKTWDRQQLPQLIIYCHWFGLLWKVQSEERYEQLQVLQVGLRCLLEKDDLYKDTVFKMKWKCTQQGTEGFLHSHCINEGLDPKCVQAKMMGMHTHFISQFDISEKAQGKWAGSEKWERLPAPLTTQFLTFIEYLLMNRRLLGIVISTMPYCQ